jgi:hypothetical protein
MHRLVGRILVSFRGLTGTEIRKHGMRHVQLQHVLDGKLSILHYQRATERICVLDTVASQMKNVSRTLLKESA